MNGKRISAVSFAVTVIALLLLFSMSSVLSAMKNTVLHEDFIVFSLEKNAHLQDEASETVKVTLLNKELFFDFAKINGAASLFAQNDDFIPPSVRFAGYGARAVVNSVSAWVLSRFDE